eukprot:3308707-Prymnesium_polylepis.1
MHANGAPVTPTAVTNRGVENKNCRWRNRKTKLTLQKRAWQYSQASGPSTRNTGFGISHATRQLREGFK